jgi:ribosome-binding protein aMBF1 (putative translation factor)
MTRMAKLNSRAQSPTAQGQTSYERWRDELWADPEYRAIYEEEAAKSELWLQLVEARQAAGLSRAQMAKRLGVSQADVARIEERGYDTSTLNELRRYVQVLDPDFVLEVSIRRREPTDISPVRAAS